MNTSLLSLCIGLPAFGLSAPLPVPLPVPDPLQVAQVAFGLEADLDYARGRIEATATLEVENVSARPVSRIPFNVGRLMTVTGVEDDRGRRLPFEQDVVTFDDDPRRQVTHVEVALPAPVAPGARTSVSIRYGGYLVGYTETGSRYIRDRIDDAFTILRSDAYAFPVLGLTSRGANRSAPRRDFDYDITVTVPEGHTVAAGGALVYRRTADGRTTFRYRSRSPVPFVNIPVAPYDTLRDGGIAVFHFKEDSSGARRVLEQTRRALSLLTDWFGPVGADRAVTVMEIPEGFGSQASLAAGIIQTADAFRNPTSLWGLYHEVSHFWNAPDIDTPSARWNEGLATFLQARLAAALDGWDGMAAWIEGQVHRQVERVSAAGAHPFAEYGRERLTDLSYGTGLLMFHVLHRTVGADAFNAAIGGYYQRHRETGGTFEAFVEHMDAATPIDLDPLFGEWVSSTAWMERVRAGESLADMAARYAGR